MVPPRSPLAARFSSALPLSHSVIRPTTGSRRRRELGRVGLGDAAQIARRLDHRHLHAEADAEIRHVALARELRRADLALGAALAEAARHQDAVDVFEERRRVLLLEHLGLDPVEIDLHLVGDAAVRERLDQRFVGVLHAGVLADDGDRDLAFRIADALVDQLPAREIGRRRDRGRRPPAPRCRALGRIGLRHRIDVVDVARLDHRALAHVAEQRELAPLLLRDFAGRCGTAGCRAGCRSSSSSLTECWVGLVFSSPALGMYGISVRWM